MDLNVRDWLIILGTLVVAGFVLDAYRRIRTGYNERIRLSAKRRDDNADDMHNPELPSGGARVVSRARAIPSYDQADSGREEAVPVLMESVELGDGDLVDHNPVDEEVSALEIDDPTETAAEALGELALSPGESIAADAGGREGLDTDDHQAEKPQAVEADVDGYVSKDNSHKEPRQKKEPSRKEAQEKKPATASRKEPGRQKAGDTQAGDPEEIIVLHVVAREGDEISGAAMLQILLACDVRYGRMNIFHRYEEAGGEGAEQFSVVNMVAPGTFDLDNIEQFSTPGVSFFMRLPGPKDAIKAFDCMVETAQVLVKNLQCELHDEAHSAATAQTLQHLRQRIRDFERRQLTLV